MNKQRRTRVEITTETNELHVVIKKIANGYIIEPCDIYHRGADKYGMVESDPRQVSSHAVELIDEWLAEKNRPKELQS